MEEDFSLGNLYVPLALIEVEAIAVVEE